MITRTFTVDRGGRKIDYVFTTFEEAIKDEYSGNMGLLSKYLKSIYEDEAPELDLPSISQLRPLYLEVERRNSDCIELAQKAGYHGASRKQHDVVQQYFLANDPYTIATEIPVWNDEIQGHIDILRIFGEKLQILDFKPKAHLEKKADAQVFRYRKALSERTGIRLKDIEAGYFDDKYCYFLI